jgi:hypothetical protein
MTFVQLSNKTDLKPTVRMRKLDKWGVEQGMLVFMVSAKRHQGVDRLFESASKRPYGDTFHREDN